MPHLHTLLRPETRFARSISKHMSNHRKLPSHHSRLYSCSCWISPSTTFDFRSCFRSLAPISKRKTRVFLRLLNLLRNLSRWFSPHLFLPSEEATVEVSHVKFKTKLANPVFTQVRFIAPSCFAHPLEPISEHLSLKARRMNSFPTLEFRSLVPCTRKNKLSWYIRSEYHEVNLPLQHTGFA